MVVTAIITFIIIFDVLVFIFMYRLRSPKYPSLALTKKVIEQPNKKKPLTTGTYPHKNSIHY